MKRLMSDSTMAVRIQKALDSERSEQLLQLTRNYLQANCLELAKVESRKIRSSDAGWSVGPKNRRFRQMKRYLVEFGWYGPL